MGRTGASRVMSMRPGRSRSTVFASLSVLATLGCGDGRRADGMSGAGGAASSGGTGESAAGVAGQSAGSGGLGTGGVGAQAGGGTSGSAGTGASGESGAGQGFFVEARVDGELFRAESDVRARWFSGLLPDYLAVDARGQGFAWTLVTTNGEGEKPCSTATITLEMTDGDQTSHLLSGPYAGVERPCSLSVDRAATALGEVMEGTFSGELTPIPGASEVTVPVTNGSFRAPRVEDGL
jgi:hypothetical protein